MIASLSTFRIKKPSPLGKTIDAGTIPSSAQWCYDQYNLNTHCQRRLAANAKTAAYAAVFATRKEERKNEKDGR